MTTKTTLAVILATVTFLTATIAPTLPITYNAQAQTSVVPPPGTSPPPGSINALTDRWWQFVLSINTQIQPNPFTTVFTGDCSFLAQPGNLLFLVETASPGGGVQNHGTCSVPAGTSILFPLVNGVDTGPASEFISNPTTEPTFVLGQPFKLLKEPIDIVKTATNLVATVDGRQLQSNFVESTPGGFAVNVASNNPVGDTPTGPGQHAVAEGFWVLLPPLPAGQHTISFGGCLPTVGFCTGTIVYGITVR
jgi:hypothetical protein